MEGWQNTFVLGFLGYSLLCLAFGIFHSRRKNYYGESFPFHPLGAYVWADAVVFGVFWTISAIVLYKLGNFNLFAAYYFVFSTVRYLGETIYWFNEQFASKKLENAKKKWPYRFFKDEHVVQFTYQTVAQCLTVVSVILAIYFTKMWLKSL